MEYKRSPSSYHQESPLASLARNASLRKDKPSTPRIHVESGYSQDGTQQQVSSQEQHTDRYRDYGQHEQGGPFYSPQDDVYGEESYDPPHDGTPPPARARPRPPSSPLLHTQFRTSTATTLTTFDMYADTSYASSSMGYGHGYDQSDDASVYSQTSYARASAGPDDLFTPQPPVAPFQGIHSKGRDTVDDFSSYYRNSQATMGDNSGSYSPPPPVPAVVVLSEDDQYGHGPTEAGRSRSAVSPSVNFSRPNRSTAIAQEGSPSTRPGIPPRSPSGQSDKAAVLARNLNRSSSSKSLRAANQSHSPRTPTQPMPSDHLTIHANGSTRSLSPSPSYFNSPSGSPYSAPTLSPSTASLNRPHSPSASPSPSPMLSPALSSRQPSSPGAISPGLSPRSAFGSAPPSPSPSVITTGAGTITIIPADSSSGSGLTRKVTLSGRPPSPPRAPRSPAMPAPINTTLAPNPSLGAHRGGHQGRGQEGERKSQERRGDTSPAASVYSSYSFYQLDANGPSPTGTRGPGLSSPADQGQDKSGRSRSPMPAFSKNGSRSTSPMPGSPAGAPGDPGPEEYLALGISHHEKNDLPRSTAFFELAAKERGGCGAGMLMYGLALRHGWGVPKDEKAAFAWLTKAARYTTEILESVNKLEKGKDKDDKKTLQKELVLAIYEVGQCFFQGWGTVKDRVAGVTYFRKAAELGDPDAQQELAFCLANGKGCKKDRKEAAKWYRDAVAQGASDVGLAWIYKEKFLD